MKKTVAALCALVSLLVSVCADAHRFVIDEETQAVMVSAKLCIA